MILRCLTASISLLVVVVGGELGLGNSTGPLVGGAGAWGLWFQDLGIWS